MGELTPVLGWSKVLTRNELWGTRFPTLLDRISVMGIESERTWLRVPILH